MTGRLPSRGWIDDNRSPSVKLADARTLLAWLRDRAERPENDTSLRDHYARRIRETEAKIAVLSVPPAAPPTGGE